MGERIVPIPSVEELRRYVRYEPESGKLFWIHVDGERNQWNAQRVGREAFGNMQQHGYKRGGFKGASLFAHRVAWALIHGYWPCHEIDHINGDPSDNRLSNLREASREQNGRNRKISKANTRGFKGVSWHKRDFKWEACIKFNGKTFHLGKFDTAEDAHAAYCDGAKILHEEFARVK